MSHQLNAQCPFHYMWGNRKSHPAGDEDQGASKKEPEAGKMPPPPFDGEMATFFHVGGWAKELLTYGFQLDAWQMQCCSKSREKLYISSFGEGYPTAKSVFGGVQGIHKSRNFHISYGWLSSQDFLNEIGFQGRGLGGSWYATIKSVVGNKNEMLLSSKILGGFEKSRLKTELMVPIYKDPLCIGYFLVSPIQNWVLGYRGVYNFDEK
ncbi:hypothetical protein KR026_007972 [Drosophila bipectinata]|nr:hypothetical protein KR026_007972 [Drosophila bipectinata]